MHAQSELVTVTLKELERLTGGLRADEISTRRVLESTATIETLLITLDRHVVPHDDLGLASASEDELVFRASRLAIRWQLARLRLTPEPAMGAGHPTSPSVEWWSRLPDVLAVAERELQRLTGLWMRYRLHGDERTPTMEVSALYLEAIRTARAELRRMDEIPDLERVLYHGVALTGHPEVTSACEQILTAMRARIDLEAVRSVWTARVNWASSGQKRPGSS